MRLVRFSNERRETGLHLLHPVILLRTIPALLVVYWALQDSLALASYMLLVTVAVEVLLSRLRTKLTPAGYQLKKELEGLTDLLSFGVAPALMAFLATPQWWMGVAASVFTLSAAYRLARFNCEGIIKGYYRGLPVNYPGALLALIYLIMWSTNSLTWLPLTFTVLLLASSVVMIIPQLRVKAL